MAKKQDDNGYHPMVVVFSVRCWAKIGVEIFPHPLGNWNIVELWCSKHEAQFFFLDPESLRVAVATAVKALDIVIAGESAVNIEYASHVSTTKHCFDTPTFDFSTVCVNGYTLKSRPYCERH